LLVTTKNLAEMLEVNPNTIANWEMCLGLNIKADDLNVKNYSQDLIVFFKKVKSLILNGYTLVAIKEFLSAEIEILNHEKGPIEAVIVEENITTNVKELNNNSSQPDVVILFEALLKELKQYTERTIEAEKKVYLLEDFENRVKQEYFELSTDVKQLKSELEEKNQKLRDYEEQKKRLNLLEVQLKIMQLEKNKKKIWEFWK